MLLTANQDAMVSAIQNNSQKIQAVSQEVASIWNIIYPVGSYYETSNPNFNPNSSWGGIWEKDTKGLVTVGAIEDGGDSPAYGTLKLSLGNTIGEAEHTLTVDEMPSHTHGLAMQAGNQSGVIDKISVNGYENCNWYSHVQYTGGGQPHNNVQPSIGVIRWHRTA